MSGSDFMTGNERSTDTGCKLLSRYSWCLFLAVVQRNIDANARSGNVYTAVKAVCNSLINSVQLDHVLVDFDKFCNGSCAEDGWLTWSAVIADLPTCCGGLPRELQLGFAQIVV